MAGRILIVDDDVDTCSNLADILADAGFDTLTAPDGEHALSIMTRFDPDAADNFDLCLLDFKMPGMDGVELLTRLRDLSPELQAIMMTGFAGEDGVQRALAAGIVKILPKPVNAAELLGMIRAAVR